jgi:hypothetical protein
MKETVIEIGDTDGNSQKLPAREIVKSAVKNGCTNISFWAKLISNKYPYVFNNEQNKLLEAGFDEALLSLKENNEVYWLTDAEVPIVSNSLKEITQIEKNKLAQKERLNQFKK